MNGIGIRIFWGPWGGEFVPTPVVSVGQMVGEFEPLTPSLVEEEKSWMLKIDDQKTVFSCYSKEPCINANGFLQLLVCVIIPTGQHLANGKSPLELLTVVRDQFGLLFPLDLHYSPSNWGKVNGRFGQLIARFPLKECPWYDFRMEGIDAASFCVDSMDQLNALMLYHAYTPLAFIGHLELGFNCKSTVDINTKGESAGDLKKEKRKWWQREKRPQDAAAHQPKPQEKDPKSANQSMPTNPTKPTETIVPPTAQHKGYQVWMNGEAQSIFLRWNEDEYYLHQESTEDVRYESLRFKLGELKAAPKRKVATLSERTVAQLDEKNNRINCEMKPVERWLYKEIAFTLDSDVEARKFVKYNPNSLKVLVDGKPWEEEKIKPSVAKRAVEKNRIRIAPKETGDVRLSLVSVKIATSAGKDRLVLTIEAKNKDDKGSYRKDVRYEVFVNGKPTGSFLSDPSDFYYVHLPSKENQYYESFSFSLGQLQGSSVHMVTSKTGNTTVRLDEANARVVCNLVPFLQKNDTARSKKDAKEHKDNDTSDNTSSFWKNVLVVSLLLLLLVGLFFLFFFPLINHSNEANKSGGLSNDDSETEVVEVIETVGFPYNTCFSGTIGSKGSMVIDSQGNGYYTYDNNGKDFRRNIKVKSYDDASGDLVIESFDKEWFFIGKFEGVTENGNSYKGTFTNYKGGTVEFDLYAVPGGYLQEQSDINNSFPPAE